MNNRGKPLAFDKRLVIQEMTKRSPIKLVARALGISRNTVRKYKFDPTRHAAG